MKVKSLQPNDPLYPASLTNIFVPHPNLTLIGNAELLATRKTAVLSSRTCPGEIILRVYDLAKKLRDSDLTFIGGFHTPVERDLLHHLLNGRCKLIICPARSIDGMRLPADWRKAIEDGRLMLISEFTSESQRRQSAQLAERRNKLVAAVADQVLLLYAAPGSRTELLAQAAAQAGKPILTMELNDEQIFQQLSQVQN